MAHTFLLFFYIAGCLVAVFGYPNGLISASCDTMLPIHGNAIPQSSAAPYVITASNTTFMPGDSITGNGFNYNNAWKAVCSKVQMLIFLFFNKPVWCWIKQCRAQVLSESITFDCNRQTLVVVGHCTLLSILENMPIQQQYGVSYSQCVCSYS